MSKVENKAKQASAGKYMFNIISLIILLIALGLTAYNAKQMRALQTNNMDQNQQIANKVSSLNNQFQQLDATINSNSESLAKLKQQIPADQNHWRIAESQYLAKLAYYHLEVSQDPKTAIKLLSASKAQLQDINGGEAFHAKQLMENAITTLQALPEFKQEALLQRLEALGQNIDKLTITKPANKTPEKITTTINTPEKSSGWQESLKATWHTLASMVVIRRLQEPVTPLLAPDQQAYLMQNLQLKLQQAEWAVLHRDQGIYQDSLSTSQAWLSKYFVLSTPAAKYMQQQLAELGKVALAPKLPDLGPLLTSLQQLNQQPTAQS